ncbi:hypothetical protein GQ457_04G018020 [Hibiscus cannabinus]
MRETVFEKSLNDEMLILILNLALVELKFYCVCQTQTQTHASKSVWEECLKSHQILQPYINNDTKVVYINQRRQKDGQPNKSSTSTSMKKCETCGWQLLPGTASRFCSIQCKVNDEGIQLEQNPLSYRKKSRKGIPIRSPFF